MSTVEERLAVIGDALQEIDGERGAQLMALRPLLPAIERLIRGETRYGQNLGGCSTEETQRLMRVFNIQQRRSLMFDSEYHLTRQDIEKAMGTAAHHQDLPVVVMSAVAAEAFAESGRRAVEPGPVSGLAQSAILYGPPNSGKTIIGLEPQLSKELRQASRKDRLRNQRRNRKGQRR